MSTRTTVHSEGVSSGMVVIGVLLGLEEERDGSRPVWAATALGRPAVTVAIAPPNKTSRRDTPTLEGESSFIVSPPLRLSREELSGSAYGRRGASKRAPHQFGRRPTMPREQLPRST